MPAMSDHQPHHERLNRQWTISVQLHSQVRRVDEVSMMTYTDQLKQEADRFIGLRHWHEHQRQLQHDKLLQLSKILGTQGSLLGNHNAMEPTTTLQHIQTRTSLAQPYTSAFWTFQTVLGLATSDKVIGILMMLQRWSAQVLDQYSESGQAVL